MFQANQVHKINMLLTVSILIGMLMSSVWSESYSLDFDNIDCGEVNKPDSNSSSSQSTTEYEAYRNPIPWSVRIYGKIKNEFLMICGGTLISTNLVVTAAHCFLKVEATNISLLIDNSNYKIAVGKHTSDTEFIQTSDVELIYMNYHDGSLKNNVDNIALIVLSRKIKTSNIVSPACIDWNSRYNVSNGMTGKTWVSWLRVNQHSGTENFKQVFEKSVSYIDPNTCCNMFNHKYAVLITNKTFCASSVQDEVYNLYVNGVGLTFIHDGKHFLTGITNIKVTEFPGSSVPRGTVDILLDVRKYIHWLQEKILEANNYTLKANA